MLIYICLKNTLRYNLRANINDEIIFNINLYSNANNNMLITLLSINNCAYIIQNICIYHKN